MQDVFFRVMIGLEEKYGKNVPIGEIYRSLEYKGISQKDGNVVMDRLKIKGDVFEPMTGYLQRV